MNLILERTLGNPEWMTKKINVILAMLPAEWEHEDNLDRFQLGVHLKIHGVFWRNDEELEKIIEFFKRTNVLQTHGPYVRANYDL